MSKEMPQGWASGEVGEIHEGKRYSTEEPTFAARRPLSKISNTLKKFFGPKPSPTPPPRKKKARR